MSPYLLLIAAASPAQSVDLSGPWKLSTTDDPRWAEPGIDDSRWPVLTLPQWLRRISGIWWLRRTVPVAPQSADLAITVGLVSESYEVYVNGSKVGGTGDVGSDNPRFVQPRSFRLPPGLIREGTPVVIALRIGRPPRGSWGALTGGVQDHGPYLIAQPAHADAEVAANLSIRQTVTPGLLIAFGQFGIGLFVLVLWFAERQRREHLFFAGFLILGSLVFVLAIWTVYTSQSYVWQRYVYRPVSFSLMLCLLQFTTIVLRVRPLRGYVVAGAALLSLPSIVLAIRFSYLYAPMALITWQCLRSLQTSGLKETRFFAFTILAYMVALLNNTLRVEWRFFDQQLALGDMSLAFTNLLQLLFATGTMILLLRRLAADRQEKQRLAAELEAGRVVQQLLLSGAGIDASHYTVDAVYRPAQEVGGDFYQVLPLRDGGLLVAVGDVSGKGLKAAMVVAMMTGVLRSHSESPPSRLLSEMNRTLGDSFAGGFVTCLAARFEPDGAVVIANAGHLAPYLLAQEQILESNLPLGVMREAEFADTALRLDPGESITFVTDGVVEAANARGELFGFDRSRELSAQPAGEIAAAAQKFGQNDDITVVTVARRRA